MKFTECICGESDFKMNRQGKMECLSCGKICNPFSAIHYKVNEPLSSSKVRFWVIMTPHFLERIDEHFPDLEDEDIVTHCSAIEKAATKNRVQATKFRGRHIYWKLFYNKYRRRMELTLISLTGKNKFRTKFHKNVEFITVNFHD